MIDLRIKFGDIPNLHDDSQLAFHNEFKTSTKQAADIPLHKLYIKFGTASLFIL